MRKHYGSIRGHSLSFAAVAFTLFILFSLVLYSTNPSSRPNALQTIAGVFFALAVIWGLARGQSGSVPNQQGFSAETRRNRKGLLWALAVGAFAYSSTVTFFFVSDDYTQLRKAAVPFVAGLWQQATVGQINAEGIPIFYRPLGFASLFLEYRIWHFWIPGYHVYGLLWHLLAIAGLFFLCEELGLKAHSCATAALLFAVMPVDVEAVTWIVCRYDRLATTFALWASVCYLVFRRTGTVSKYLVALCLFVLAALSKETAFVLPVVWLALDFVVFKRPRVKFILGYVAVAALIFMLRWHVLGGIAGYRMSNGTPAARHLTKTALTAILLRQPSEILFGYNWLQPSSVSLTFVAAATAAIFFTLIFFTGKTSSSRRVAYFGLIWVFVAGVPTHFLFWRPDVGLTFSRILYFGSTGLAILVASLFDDALRLKTLHKCWAGVLCLLFLSAVFHNLRAWRLNSDVSRIFLAELRQIVPTPPAGATISIENMPLHLRGVPLFKIGLREAVQFAYGRNDIFTYRAPQLPVQQNSTAIRLRWTGILSRPIERGQR